MLKGHVFSKQLFGHPVFAVFVNTFLNGRNGVSDNYKEGMEMSYSGSTVTIFGGLVCIQGRFLEEDTHTEIPTGNDTAYCKLVIEIDLDKQNTESDFTQASYKIIKSASGYPNLTQTNIVKNNSGIYQYELARFRTNVNGISEFVDMRTYLNFSSIYDAMEQEYMKVLSELQQKLTNVEDGSEYLLKGNIAVLTGSIEIEESTSQGVFDGEGDKIISYPTGFTKNNCRIISIATSLPAQGFYSTGSIANTFKPLDVQMGMFPIYVTRRNTDLKIKIYNPLKQKGNINYEIVLLRI